MQLVELEVAHRRARRGHHPQVAADWGGQHDAGVAHLEGFAAAVGEQGEQLDHVELVDEVVCQLDERAGQQFQATVDAQFAKVTDVKGAAELALLLEQTAADTYLGAQNALTGKDAITRAGALQSVDQEHAAILLYVLGRYPVPKDFQSTEKAFKG